MGNRMDKKIPGWHDLTAGQKDAVAHLEAGLPESGWFRGKMIRGQIEYLVATENSVISLWMSGATDETHTSELAGNGDGWTTGYEA